MRTDLFAGSLLSVLLAGTVMFAVGSVNASSVVWAVSLDASSSGQTDVTVSSSASNVKSFRVGAVINATGSSPLIGVYGWQLTVNYNRSMFIPQGDPNPLATVGNSLGLYPDGAVNTVLFGAQTTAGTVNWAGLVSAGGAFGSFRVNSTLGRVTVFFTMLGSSPAAVMSANTLLANVNFEILNKTSSPQSFTLSNIIFVDSNNRQISGVVAGTSVTETVTNAPPHATFTEAPAPKVGAYAYTFNAKSSSDSDDKIPNPGGYFWDFGDGTQDLGLTGITVTHNYTQPGLFNVTLRVQDNLSATGSARDSLGNVVSDSQPSHMYVTIGQSSGAPLTSMATSDSGCLGLSEALSVVGSSSQFRQLDSIETYLYTNFGTASDGALCRMVLFYAAQSGDGLEAVVNPDRTIESVAQLPRGSPNFPDGGPSQSEVWSGYEAGCDSCSNGGNTVLGAYFTFTIPTVYTPTSGAVLLATGSTDCCLMAEWVGAGSQQRGGASTASDPPDVFFQAGLQKATNSWASDNNVAFEQIWVGGKSVEKQEVAWPCPGGLSDGDTFAVTVLRVDTSKGDTHVDFQFTALNLNQVNCTFNFSSRYGNQTSQLATLHWGYFIVETPAVLAPQCTGTFTNHTSICELPAWGSPTQENGWVIPSCCANVPISDSSITHFEDVLNQCISYTPNFQNVAVSPLTGNSWSTAWLTSKRQDSSTKNPCSPAVVPDFTFVPYPNPVYFNSGSLNFQSGIAFNSVAGYSGTISTTASETPASGLAVYCPRFTLPSMLSRNLCN